MTDFRQLDDVALSQLGDEELVEYAQSAREAGEPIAAVAARQPSCG